MVAHSGKNLSFTFWFIQRVVKRCVPLFNIQIVCANPELFTQHQGFIFPNHISYLDIIVIVALTPSRFVAKAEVAKMPFIGWIAQQVQTVFVKRQDKRSRLQTREVLGTLTYYPPVVLFPEGGTNRDLSIPWHRFDWAHSKSPHNMAFHFCPALFAIIQNNW